MFHFLLNIGWPGAVVLVVFIVAMLILLCFLYNQHIQASHQKRADYLKQVTPGALVDQRTPSPRPTYGEDD